jgi:pantetheine-phosphate adenylyltransferase
VIRFVKKKIEIVAVGGTFDEFHRGHRALLRKAFEVGKHVLIGLCSDDFVKRLKKPHKIAPYKERLEELQSFLRARGVLERAEIIPLNDPYGVTISENRLDAIVVSKETELRAHEINEKRRSMRLPPLKVFVIDMILAEDYFPISSTRIWLEEIDREGHLL